MSEKKQLFIDGYIAGFMSSGSFYNGDDINHDIFNKQLEKATESYFKNEEQNQISKKNIVLDVAN